MQWIPPGGMPYVGIVVPRSGARGAGARAGGLTGPWSHGLGDRRPGLRVCPAPAMRSGIHHLGRIGSRIEVLIPHVGRIAVLTPCLACALPCPAMNTRPCPWHDHGRAGGVRVLRPPPTPLRHRGEVGRAGGMLPLRTATHEPTEV